MARFFLEFYHLFAPNLLTLEKHESFLYGSDLRAIIIAKNDVIKLSTFDAFYLFFSEFICVFKLFL